MSASAPLFLVPSISPFPLYTGTQESNYVWRPAFVITSYLCSPGQDLLHRREIRNFVFPSSLDRSTSANFLGSWEIVLSSRKNYFHLIVDKVSRIFEWIVDWSECRKTRSRKKGKSLTQWPWKQVIRVSTGIWEWFRVNLTNSATLGNFLV